MRMNDRRTYALLSIVAALVTVGLKAGAFAFTGSVGLLSDALESVVNLVAALVALWALWLAAQPADDVHTYGHTKAEYISSGAEGGLIVLAAVSIIAAAVPRLMHPQGLDKVGIGLAIAALSAVVNGFVAWVLSRAGTRLRSVALQADARHLLTDVFTTGGVLIGVALVSLTGWLILDPIVALLVAANVVWTGWKLLHESGLGLLDTALEPEDQRAIAAALVPFEERGIAFHAQRTRRAGMRRFVSMHVLVPGDWTVQRGHDLCEEVEHAIHRTLPDSTVFTHLEPAEDPIAYDDIHLDRPQRSEASGV
jgi:cation diffusion facilitator family transporter